MTPKQNKRLQQAINGLLIFAVVAVAGWLSTRYKFEADWTAGNRNTLTVASQNFLATLKDPIKVLVFDYPNSENKPEIKAWVDRYTRFKKDITLEYVDPSAQPAKVKQYNIGARGEVVIEYQGRHESLRQLSEQTFTGALQRLTDAGEHYVVFVEGHGERSAFPTGKDNQNDFTQFADALTAKGLKVQALNLVKTPRIPDNTSVLVLASPTQALLPGEVALITDYVKHGGNLLWLTDPEVQPGLVPVANELGIQWQNGVVIFAAYQVVGSPSPAVFYATDYPPNPVTQDLREITAFPLARSLTWDKDAVKAGGWNAQPLVETDETSWLETGKLDGPVSFDPKAGDLPGPLTLGLTLTRQHKDEGAPGPDGKPTEGKARTQRVVLFGDSDFLADANLKALGNQRLGLNIVQWLASRDAQINVDIPKAPDITLRLPAWGFWILAASFTLLLPIGLLGFGVGRWIVRRRA